MRKLLVAAVSAVLMTSLASCTSNDSEPAQGSATCDAQCTANINEACDGQCTASDGSAVPIPDYDEPTVDPLPDYSDDLPTDDYTPEDTSTKVTFEVTGKGRALQITYVIDGQISQATNKKLPWKKTVSLPEPGSIGYNMNAQLSDGRRIGCSISVDDIEQTSNTSTGQYSFVSCQTRA